jgi:glycosyltransferase involved in cell wall biosynthesis
VGPRVPVDVVPNAAPPELLLDDRRPATDPLVATVARLHPDKGLDVLLDAFALLRAEHPAARLVVIGGSQPGWDGYGDELRAHADRAGAGGAVRFTGFVDRPADEWAAAWAYVQPARDRSEILPLAILEALGSGVPVVATDVGGVADVVVDGATGLLVPPDDPDALARALHRLLADPDLARDLAAAGRARVRERHTVERMVDAVEATYRALGFRP